MYNNAGSIVASWKSWLDFIWGIWGSIFYLEGCKNTLVFSKLEMTWQGNLAEMRASYAKQKSIMNFQNGGILCNGIFPIWYTSSKKGRGSELSLDLFLKNMVFTSKTQHLNDKKWKIIEKNPKKKTISGIFFRYEVIQESAWFRVFIASIFKSFFRAALNQSEIRLWKFQVTLVSSFEDI